MSNIPSIGSLLNKSYFDDKPNNDNSMSIKESFIVGDLNGGLHGVDSQGQSYNRDEIVPIKNSLRLPENQKKNVNNLETGGIDSVIHETTDLKGNSIIPGPVQNLNNFEGNLLESLYLFNNEYNYYAVQCVEHKFDSGYGDKDPNYVPDDNINNPDGLTCGDIAKIIQQDSQNIQNYINENQDLTTGLETKNVTDASYNYIINTHKEIRKTRNDLDLKLRELYDIENSSTMEQSYNFDSTVYGGVLVTILASVLVFYTFSKL
jgi:hypothetical protein